jgi:hypothetical protein
LQNVDHYLITLDAVLGDEQPHRPACSRSWMHVQLHCLISDSSASDRMPGERNRVITSKELSLMPQVLGKDPSIAITAIPSLLTLNKKLL